MLAPKRTRLQRTRRREQAAPPGAGSTLLAGIRPRITMPARRPRMALAYQPRTDVLVAQPQRAERAAVLIGRAAAHGDALPLNPRAQRRCGLGAVGLAALGRIETEQAQLYSLPARRAVHRIGLHPDRVAIADACDDAREPRLAGH